MTLVEPPTARPDAEKHLAFARSLALVAARYLAECEREQGLDDVARYALNLDLEAEPR
jgi:hypothetical protein